MDYREGDVFFWVTDIGWMMGPWEFIGVQFYGGTYFIFDGAPNWPEPDRCGCHSGRVEHLNLPRVERRMLLNKSIELTPDLGLPIGQFLPSQDVGEELFEFDSLRTPRFSQIVDADGVLTPLE